MKGGLQRVGMSSPELLGATSRQLWKLRILDRRDYRGKGLTRQRASELISELQTKSAKEKEGLTDIADKMFSAMMKKATDEADLAGDAWLKAHPESLMVINDPESEVPIGVHGQIGKAWLTWPRRGTEIYKWMIANNHDGQTKSLDFDHKYAHRLEVDLQIRCLMAAIQVYRDAGIILTDVALKARCEYPEMIGQAA